MHFSGSTSLRGCDSGCSGRDCHSSRRCHRCFRRYYRCFRRCRRCFRRCRRYFCRCHRNRLRSRCHHCRYHCRYHCRTHGSGQIVCCAMDPSRICLVTTDRRSGLSGGWDCCCSHCRSLTHDPCSIRSGCRTVSPTSHPATSPGHSCCRPGSLPTSHPVLHSVCRDPPWSNSSTYMGRCPAIHQPNLCRCDAPSARSVPYV